MGGEGDKLYELYAVAKDYYHTQLLDPQKGKIAREYLAGRGISEALIHEFQLGWASEEWQALFTFLSRKGFPEKSLLTAGLAKQSAGGRMYDLFRARILFPIVSLQGKTVGFGGRLLKDGEGPKYLNSPESPIFQKRRELFGLFFAKKFMDPDRPRLLVVEGYMDFLALYAAGFKNTVATLGTALTEQHVQVMKRFAAEAVVIYDGDKAGQAASLKGLEVFLEGGMNVKLVRMPEGYDPDEWIKEKGAESFQKLIDQAMDFFDFKLDAALARYNIKDPLGVVKITGDFLDTLAKVGNSILASHYLTRLSGLVKIDEATLRSELARLKAKPGWRPDRAGNQTYFERTPKAQEKNFPSEELILLVLMVDDRGIRSQAFSELKESDFSSRETGEMFRSLVLAEENGEPLSWPMLLARMEGHLIKDDLLRLAALDWQAEERTKAFQDCMAGVRQKRAEIKLEALKTRIALAEKKCEPSAVNLLIQEYQSLIASSKK